MNGIRVPGGCCRDNGVGTISRVGLGTVSDGSGTRIVRGERDQVSTGSVSRGSGSGGSTSRSRNPVGSSSVGDCCVGSCSSIISGGT
jgi:hypothetical protein